MSRTAKEIDKTKIPMRAGHERASAYITGWCYGVELNIPTSERGYAAFTNEQALFLVELILDKVDENRRVANETNS